MVPFSSFSLTVTSDPVVLIRPAFTAARKLRRLVLDSVTSTLIGSSWRMVVSAVDWPELTSAPSVMVEASILPADRRLHGGVVEVDAGRLQRRLGGGNVGLGLRQRGARVVEVLAADGVLP